MDRKRRRSREVGLGSGNQWLYGRHVVVAALANPRRRPLQVRGSRDALDSIAESLARHPGLEVRVVARGDLDQLLPSGSVHQGLALKAEPLPAADLEETCAALPSPRLVVLLDRVTDPHNVGAILRSAAAFGAGAVILTERHAPPVTGALAKAASGALERVPLVRVGNLARALALLGDLGFWRVALDARGVDFAHDFAGQDVALVLGAEGEGLRRLTRDSCDIVARLPTRGDYSSLNVSTAAAVALCLLGRSPGAIGTPD
jgi:23S rRNA (guanosine2251-2'-O)-methyltransferase